MEVQLIWASRLVLMVFRVAGPVWLKNESIFLENSFFTAVEVRVQGSASAQASGVMHGGGGGESFGLQQRLEINAPLPEINMSGLFFLMARLVEDLREQDVMKSSVFSQAD